MPRRRLDTYTAYRVSDNSELHFMSLDEAKRAIEGIVGNRSGRKLFPNENTFLYGPGDGTTSFMIKQDSVVE